MKQRIISMLLCAAMVFALFPAAVLAADPPYTYLEDGEVKDTGTTPVTLINASNKPTAWSGRYIVQGEISIDATVTVTGSAHLILADGAKLEITADDYDGIKVMEGNSLTIYAQSTGDEMGALCAIGNSGGAAIGSTNRAGIGKPAKNPQL